MTSAERLSPPADPQSARAVLMVRPYRFAANAETAASNRFQEQDRRVGTMRSGGTDSARTLDDESQVEPAEHAQDAVLAEGAQAIAMAARLEQDAVLAEDAQAIAMAARLEFDALATALADAGVVVHVLEGRSSPLCPDELFPNNWLSTHADGTLVLYPMQAPNRRRERRPDAIDRLQDSGYSIHATVDLTALEQQNLFLEGTGSLVLDRQARLAYACVSARTSPAAVATFCERLGYEPVIFDARDRHGHPIFHTNVLMSVGTEFAIVCSAAIPERQRQQVLGKLAEHGRRVIEIGFDSLHAFAGNLLELQGQRGTVIALSRRALASLDTAQTAKLSEHGELITVPIDTIERYGGGSVRCMLAEIHLPHQAV